MRGWPGKRDQAGCGKAAQARYLTFSLCSQTGACRVVRTVRGAVWFVVVQDALGLGTATVGEAGV